MWPVQVGDRRVQARFVQATLVNKRINQIGESASNKFLVKSKMVQFPFIALTDMHFVYGEAEGNSQMM